MTSSRGQVGSHSGGQTGGRTEFDPAQLIADHHEGVWRYLRAMGCDAALAEDLTQDTFLKVLQKPFEVYDSAATAAYLRRIARNLFISYHRRMGRVVAVEDIQQFDSQWSVWIRDESGQEFLDALAACFDLLNHRAQLALTLRFRDEASRNQIADALELSAHGAKNLMQRAKQQLRDCINRRVNSDGQV